jgi:hypothetical protein
MGSRTKGSWETQEDGLVCMKKCRKFWAEEALTDAKQKAGAEQAGFGEVLLESSE